MKPDKHFGDILSPIFLQAERDLLDQAQAGQIGEEDHITGRLLTLAQDRINRFAEEDSKTFEAHSLRITARQFTGRGRNSEESRTGADSAIGLHVKLDNLEVYKYYIFQAKKSSPAKFDNRAIGQRDLMLHCTPDSFFVVFAPKEIKCISAFMVEAGDKFTELPSKSFTELNKDFFDCFIGDHFYRSPDLPPFGPPWRYYPYDYPYYPVAKQNLLIEITAASKEK